MTAPSEAAACTIQEIEAIVSDHEKFKLVYPHHPIVLEKRVFDEGVELHIRSKHLSGLNASRIFSALENCDFEITAEDSTATIVAYLQ